MIFDFCERKCSSCAKELLPNDCVSLSPCALIPFSFLVNLLLRRRGWGA